MLQILVATNSVWVLLGNLPAARAVFFGQAHSTVFCCCCFLTV
jgi:hypothetical protein